MPRFLLQRRRASPFRFAFIMIALPGERLPLRLAGVATPLQKTDWLVPYPQPDTSLETFVAFQKMSKKLVPGVADLTHSPVAAQSKYVVIW